MVRVLAIDDERNILSSLKDRVCLSKQPIEFVRFGIDINYLSSKQDIFETEYLNGCNMSFKKEVIESLPYLKFFNNYSLGEDL